MTTEQPNTPFNIVTSFPFKHKIGRVIGRVASPVAGYTWADVIQENTGDMQASTALNIAAACGTLAVVHLIFRHELARLDTQE